MLDIAPWADHNALTRPHGRQRVTTPSDHSRPFTYRLAIAIVRPLLMLFTKREWSGAENLPTEGGYVVCPNHYSYLEPLVFGHFLVDHGHSPRYLGKVEVFKTPVVGAIVRNADQIPVYRESGRAADSYRAAVAAVRAGKGVAIYPEGTLTRDPDLWPMRGKTGAARVALETRCPVIPVATWGAHEVLAPYSTRLRLLPRRTMQVRAGAPVRLDDLHGREITTEVLHEATARIMAAITAELEVLRGEKAPVVRFDPRTHGITVDRQAAPLGGGLMTSAAVYGTGSWGTAFASVLADAGTDVTMWGRRQEVVDQVNDGVNRDYLPELRLPSTIRATTDPVEAAEGADIVVLAVPSQTLRANLTAWGSALPSSAAVVSLMKGVELGTTKRMSEVIAEVGGVENERIVIVSGPNLAREIAVKQPAASVVASASAQMAELVAAACAAPYFRPYTASDVVGTEICGAVKNVIALAVGMAEGLGMGDNSKASIITRGLAETMRLGTALGGDAVTFAGLAGVGDLIATCMSPLSRNHSFGVRLGQGMAVSEVVSVTKQTAEGVKSCTSILDLARNNGVDVPIIEQVDAMIQHDRTAPEVVAALLSRPRKAETA